MNQVTMISRLSILFYSLAFIANSFKVFPTQNRFQSSLLRHYGANEPLSYSNLRSEFTVEKATEETLKSMNVKSWGTWSTNGSEKYKVGIKSPKKVYDCNELSYVKSGKMEITPVETGIPVVIEAGDFVTFPEYFACYWYVIEPIVKSYYIY